MAYKQLRLAVATNNGLFTASFNSDLDCTSVKTVSDEPHYGIAVDYEQSFLYAKSIHWGDYYPTKMGLDVYDISSNPPVETGFFEFPPWIYYTHQIARARQGFYIANTGYNSLVYLDRSTTRHEYFFEGRRSDWNHVNSVVPAGQYVVVMLHNRSPHRLSELAILQHQADSGFTLVDRKVLPYSGCHNIYSDENALYFNSSRSAGVAKIYPDRPSRKSCTLDGHTKGLAVAEELLIVGVSEYAVRGERSATDGSLVFLDRSSLRRAKVFDLSRAIKTASGNINEVRALIPREDGKSLSADGLETVRRYRPSVYLDLYSAAVNQFFALKDIFGRF